MLVKGDYIRLVKPMGEFKNVGEECEVLNIYNGIIEFRFGKYHMGQMDYNAYKEYFEKVESNDKTYIGDKVIMVAENNMLKPMCIGDKFVISSIQYGVVGIHTVDGTKTFYITEDVFNKHFKVDNVANDDVYSVSVTAEQIDDIINNSIITKETIFNKCTIVACQLPNGFVIVESSACVDPKNYDAEIGFQICMKNIKDKVWELEGYNLQCKNPIEKQMMKIQTSSK